jgi:hypothetical protein
MGQLNDAKTVGRGTIMSSNKGIEEIGSEATPLSWGDFKKSIKADIADNKKLAGSGLMHSDWIYRGQSNSDWVLQTSLERYVRDELGTPPTRIPVRDYYIKLSAIVPAINSLTNNKFEDFNPIKLDYSGICQVPECELLCYARHHGFPTPLLDWTESYYVAAFFAFSGAKKGQKENISIYAYKHWNGTARGGWVAEPNIEQLGGYIQTHPRHYAQQSNYTVCRVQTGGAVYFANHEDALSSNPDNQRLKKFIINAAEKEKVLEELYAMNINEHTLLGDEGALVRTLAYKAFILKRS